MRSSPLLGAAAALLLASPFASASASSHGSSHRKRDAHHRHVKRSDPRVHESRDYDVTYANGTSSHELAKRQSYTGRGTFYYTGLGACGGYNKDSDFIVALNTPQYNEYGGGYPGPQCFKWITVQANGVTVGGVQITDECPTCDWGSLDLSPGLFTQFAPESVGVLSITWWFDGSGGGQQSTSTTPQWTPTASSTTPEWTPTTSSSQWTTSSSTWSQTTTSTTDSSTTSWSAPPSSNTTTWSSTTTAANTTTNPFVVATSLNSTAAASATTGANATVTDANGNSVPVPATAPPPVTGNNLEAINGLVTNYGQIVVAAAGGKATS